MLGYGSGKIFAEKIDLKNIEPYFLVPTFYTVVYTFTVVYETFNISEILVSKLII